MVSVAALNRRAEIMALCFPNSVTSLHASRRPRNNGVAFGWVLLLSFAYEDVMCGSDRDLTAAVIYHDGLSLSIYFLSGEK